MVRRRGIFVAETIIGTALMVVIWTAVIVALAARHRIAAKLAGERDATRQLQSALLDLQTRHSLPDGIRMRSLPTAAAPGWHWVQVDRDGIALDGVVPDGIVSGDVAASTQSSPKP